jgi:hypothetical protein
MVHLILLSLYGKNIKINNYKLKASTIFCSAPQGVLSCASAIHLISIDMDECEKLSRERGFAEISLMLLLFTY